MEVAHAPGDNNDPPEDLNWRPPVVNENEGKKILNCILLILNCILLILCRLIAALSNRRKRGANSNRKMKDTYERSGYKPLPIQFDIADKQTARPIGPNANFFSNFLGTLADSVPKYYPSWLSVPETEKTMIWPEIEVYTFLE